MRRLLPALAALLVLSPPLRGQDIPGTVPDSIRYFILSTPGDSSADPAMPKVTGDDFVTVDRQPVPLLTPPPARPKTDGRKPPLRATVWCLCLVGTDGKVTNARVLRSDAPLLEEAALAAVRTWRFAPALKGGKPIAVWTAIPVRFGGKG